MANSRTSAIIVSDWYEELIGELRAILSEAHFNIQTEILRGKWEIGRRIVQDELNFKKAGYGNRVVEMLSKELDISPQTIWRSIQFYKKFKDPEFDSVVQKIQIEGKTPSWHKVCREILPAQIESGEVQVCDHENLMCLRCRKRFSMKELKG